MDLVRILSTVPYFIEYFFLQVDDHALHAPLIYDFYRHCIRGIRHRSPLTEVEHLRRSYLRSDARIDVLDLGAGAARNTTRPVSRIAARSASGIKTCLFLQALVEWLQPRQVLELGTSLGFSAMYLASDKKTHVSSIEGCAGIAALARQNVQKLGYANVEILTGAIEKVLSGYLRRRDREIDLVFLDADHRKEAVLSALSVLLPHMSSEAVIVVDDIRWSPGMMAAWNAIRSRTHFRLTADLGHHGVLFTHQLPEKQHYVLQF